MLPSISDCIYGIKIPNRLLVDSILYDSEVVHVKMAEEQLLCVDGKGYQTHMQVHESSSGTSPFLYLSEVECRRSLTSRLVFQLSDAHILVKSPEPFVHLPPGPVQPVFSSAGGAF